MTTKKKAQSSTARKGVRATTTTKQAAAPTTPGAGTHSLTNTPLHPYTIADKTEQIDLETWMRKRAARLAAVIVPDAGMGQGYAADTVAAAFAEVINVLTYCDPFERENVAHMLIDGYFPRTDTAGWIQAEFKRRRLVFPTEQAADSEQ